MLGKHYMEPRKSYMLAFLLSMTLGLLATMYILNNNLNKVVDAAAAEIYLNPSSGNDSNNGTSRSAAVKTFAKAKELVTAGGTIVICSELALTGNIDGAKTTGTRIKLARKGASEATSAAYKDIMISVSSGTVNISNLIVDGGAVWTGTEDETLGRRTTNSGVTANYYLLYTKGTTTITNCDFQNNDAVLLAPWLGSTGGGGIKVEGGTFTMNSGAIKDNSLTSSDALESNGGGIYVNNGGTFRMSGGTVSGNSASGRGGGVCVETSMTNVSATCTFILSGGTISGNSVFYSGSYTAGGGVAIGGIFVMENGEISGNRAHSSSHYARGGGVYESKIYGSVSYFNMNGGTISNNSATSTSSFANGGGVYARTFTMTGGTVSGNSVSGSSSSANGGGVYADKVNISGAVNISGNTNKNDNTANNVYLENGKTITLVGGLSGTGKVGITSSTAPTADTPVDVVVADGTIVTAISNVNKAYFTSDNTSYRLIKSSDSTKIQLHALPSPTFTVTIPASVESSTTTKTINLTASLSNFIAGTDNVDVKLTVPTGGLFSLVHPNDESSVIKYRVKKGSTVLGAGTQTVATFNTTTNSQALTYEITDTTGAKYAGAHNGQVTFTVAYRES